MKKTAKDLELKLTQESVSSKEAASLESTHENEQTQDPYWS